jgi:Uncharacterised BCR, YnfA/UPF0060 family
VLRWRSAGELPQPSWNPLHEILALVRTRRSGRDCWLLRVLDLAAARQKPALDPRRYCFACHLRVGIDAHRRVTAGRAFAAYGGIYILFSLLWLWIVEKTRPDQWDVIGASICLVGAAVILFGPRNI